MAVESESSSDVGQFVGTGVGGAGSVRVTHTLQWQCHRKNGRGMSSGESDLVEQRRRKEGSARVPKEGSSLKPTAQQLSVHLGARKERKRPSEC